MAESEQNSENYGKYNDVEPYVIKQEAPKRTRFGIWLNIVLFAVTFFTTTFAGVGWLNMDPYDLNNFKYGLTYSILLLLFLSSHEFGHYFAAKIHKVKVTLPYYIPFPLFLNPFGTMGAVIRMQSPSKSRKALFDIGIAGPIAGFIVACAFLIYGMTHLPPFEYIYKIHPEYMTTGVPTSGFSFGINILYFGLGKILTGAPHVFLPPMNEMYHYPFLCVGWFGLLVTALNLLPVGQLDGGHVTYSLLGSKHRIIARVFFILTLSMGLIGLPGIIDSIFIELGYKPLFNFIALEGYGFGSWFLWSILMFFVIKIDHPPIYDPEPIGTPRKLLGLFALFMFLVSFTPVPFNNF